MNLSLLDKLVDARNAILATILSTQGHTYKKAGAKALFELDRPTPLWGNLGAGCSERDILEHGRDVLAGGTSKRITIDSRDESDIHFGSGTFCGGLMEVLIEPVDGPRRKIYRDVRERLRAGAGCTLVHDLESGAVSIAEEGASAESGDAVLVEHIAPLVPLFLFGATPLAITIARLVADMEFRVTVVDWREDYLDNFLAEGYTTVLDPDCAFEAPAMVLLLSHSFQRDMVALENALRRGCRYIGLLSSTTRRDKMYEQLEERGVARPVLARVHSPVGVDIDGRSDAEIAVSIVAELIRCKNE